MADLTANSGHYNFVGRVEELHKVNGLLQNPQCRLLNIVGPGGIGKTSLALSLINNLGAGNIFTDGVHFIDLLPLDSEKFITFLIAEVLKFNIQNPHDVTTELVHHLQDKHLLLVLDNFEHLMKGIPLLLTILGKTPDVKLLITSREVLNIKNEWVFQLTGLSFPLTSSLAPANEAARDDLATLNAFAAIQLFTDIAHRSNPSFSLAREKEYVIQLCQLVEGLPLALEIAASNLKFLSCEALLAEYRLNLDNIQTRLQDISTRHRSMRAVFDTSWQLLTLTEKTVLSKLAIFKEGFTAEAANQIAGCNLGLLLTLCEKSLVQSKPNQRFYLHELLRQYVWAYLSPNEQAEIYQDFSAYYTNYVGKAIQDISNFLEREAVKQIGLELDNVRLTWHWLLSEYSTKTAEITQVARSLFIFYDCNRYAEGVDLFETSVQELQKQKPESRPKLILARLLTYLGWFYQPSDAEKSVSCLKQAIDFFSELNIQPYGGLGTNPQVTLAMVYLNMGKYNEAIALATTVTSEAETHQDYINQALAFYMIARGVYSLGDYTEAKTYASTACRLLRKASNLSLLVNCLRTLAFITRAQGNFSEAGEYASESLAISQALENDNDIAGNFALLAEIALDTGDYPQALELYTKSWNLMQSSGHKINAAIILHGIGKAYLGLTQYEEAIRFLINSLQLALDSRSVTVGTTITRVLGELFVKRGQPGLAVTLLSLVKYHPATLQKKQGYIDQLLLTCGETLPRTVYLQAVEKGKTSQLDDVVAIVNQHKYLLTRVQPSSHQPKSLVSPSSLLRPSDSTKESTPELAEFTEQLTARELEVLAMLAQGFTNQEIAEKFFLSTGTVKSHNYNIFSKLGVKNRVQAIKRAKILNIL